MQEIRVLGHLPGWTKEAPLASRLKRAKASEELSASQLAELEAMPPCSRRATGACATEILMTEIRTFGSFPSRQSVDIKENRLAERLRHFQRKNLLSASQLAELEQMPRTEPRDASQRAAERPEILMEEIRALGHLPRRTKGHEVEFALYERLSHAKRNSQLSKSQLAELAGLPTCSQPDTAERMVSLVEEIRALGHIPRLQHENSLYKRWRYAKRNNLLSETQLAALAEVPGSREVLGAARVDTLMSEIRALGHIPRWRPDEYSLAQRLLYAKSKNLLSESQLAELAELSGSESRDVRRTARADALMAEIRTLGHIPRWRLDLREEYSLAARLRTAKTSSLLSESQLAELAALQASESRMRTLMAQIRALGHIPRQSRGAETALSARLYHAKRKRQLSESQLAELAELARSSSEPPRKRLRVLNDDV